MKGQRNFREIISLIIFYHYGSQCSAVICVRYNKEQISSVENKKRFEGSVSDKGKNVEKNRGAISK